MAVVVTPLSQNWSWKQRDMAVASVLDELSSSWSSATSFPSEVHVELLKAGRIPDPFIGFNEHEVQCEYISMTCRVCIHIVMSQGLATASGCTSPSSTSRRGNATSNLRNSSSRG